MPLQRASALHEAVSLCAPQGSPWGEGHQSEGLMPQVPRGSCAGVGDGGGGVEGDCAVGGGGAVAPSAGAGVAPLREHAPAITNSAISVRVIWGRIRRPPPLSTPLPQSARGAR